MLEELSDRQERFEPYLKNGHYSFIGPVDQNLFEPFMKTVNRFAPVKSFSRSIHDVLSNKQAVQKTLGMFPDTIELRIYVVQKSDSQILLHDTIEGYCEKNNVDFEE